MSKKFSKIFPEYESEEVISSFSCKQVTPDKKTSKNKGQLYITKNNIFYNTSSTRKKEKIIINFMDISSIEKRKLDGLILEHSTIEIECKSGKFYFSGFSETNDVLYCLKDIWGCKYQITKKESRKTNLRKVIGKKLFKKSSSSEIVEDSSNIEFIEHSSMNEDEQDNINISKSASFSENLAQLTSNDDNNSSNNNIPSITISSPEDRKLLRKHSDDISISSRKSPKSPRFGSLRKPRIRNDNPLVFKSLRKSKNGDESSISEDFVESPLKVLGSAKDKIKKGLKDGTEQILKPIESFKDNVKHSLLADSYQYELSFTENDFIPSGILYKVTVTIIEGKCFGQNGGYASVFLSDVINSEDSSPFFSAKTEKQKSDNPIWNAKLDSILYDDRCYKLKLNIRTSYEVFIGTTSVIITDPTEFADYLAWLPIVDTKSSEHPKCLIRIKIQCEPLKTISESVKNNKLSESNDSVQNKLNVGIVDSPHLNKACKSSFKWEDKQESDNTNIHKDRGNIPQITRPNNRNRGKLLNVIKKSSDDKILTKNKLLLDDNYFQNTTLSPEQTLQVDTDKDISIPFEFISPIISLSKEIFHPNDDLLDLGEDSIDIKPLESIEENYNYTINLPKDKQDFVTVPFMLITEPCFKPITRNIRQIRKAKFDTDDAELRIDHIALATLRAKIIGYDLTSLQPNSALELQYNMQYALETPEEIKARIFEEKLLKSNTLNEINNMHNDVNNKANSINITVGKNNNSQYLLTKTTTTDDWKQWRDQFTQKITKTEQTMSKDIDTVHELENPVHETWEYCKRKFTKEYDINQDIISPQKKGRHRQKQKQILKDENKKEVKNEQVEEQNKELTNNHSNSELKLRKRKQITDKSDIISPSTSKESPKFSSIHYIIGAIIIFIIIYYMFIR